MEKTAHDIILRPIISEASMIGVANKKYTFEVAKTATKVEIAKAIPVLFGKEVKVDKVNTMRVRGTLKRMGRNEGYTPSWKKAIVTLKADSKGIEFFEGMF